MQTEKPKKQITGPVLAGLLIAYSSTAIAGGYRGPYGFGTTPTEAEIKAVDIDAMGDGRGLPPGRGTYKTGKAIYAERCAACHGEKLQGVKEVSAPALIGGRGTVGTAKTKATIESFWPYAPTIFDYVKRAMPFNAPGSLTDDEIYSVVAFILGEAKIIKKDKEMNAKSLAQVEMPNRNGFVHDPRPDVFNYD